MPQVKAVETSIKLGRAHRQLIFPTPNTSNGFFPTSGPEAEFHPTTANRITMAARGLTT